MAFVDRQGTNLNRKKLKVVGSPIKDANGNNITELVVDMERADSPTTQGTPLNAATLNGEIANTIANNPYLAKATADTQPVYDKSNAVATTEFVWNVLEALGHTKINNQNPPGGGSGGSGGS